MLIVEHNHLPTVHIGCCVPILGQAYCATGSCQCLSPWDFSVGRRPFGSKAILTHARHLDYSCWHFFSKMKDLTLNNRTNHKLSVSPCTKEISHHDRSPFHTPSHTQIGSKVCLYTPGLPPGQESSQASVELVLELESFYLSFQGFLCILYPTSFSTAGPPVVVMTQFRTEGFQLQLYDASQDLGVFILLIVSAPSETVKDAYQLVGKVNNVRPSVA
ncbi:UNVERIFIED_CONTAM: hypothetical protein K2H54_038780 [Gekko kuhli]